MKTDGNASPLKAIKKSARGQRRNHVARLTTDAQPPLNKRRAGKKPRGEEVRERVLHAALECFGAFGFEGTSTRAVAERAGLSHPLLLYHFESKDQLWRSTIADVIVHYRAELEDRIAKAGRKDAGAALHAFIENFVRFSARVPQLHRIMTQESTQGSERIHWVLENHLQDSFKDICKLIRKAQSNKLIRAGDPARLYYAIIGLGGTLLSVSTEFKILTGRDVFSENELQQTIEHIWQFLAV